MYQATSGGLEARPAVAVTAGTSAISGLGAGPMAPDASFGVSCRRTPGPLRGDRESARSVLLLAPSAYGPVVVGPDAGRSSGVISAIEVALAADTGSRTPGVPGSFAPSRANEGTLSDVTAQTERRLGAT